ncbi:MAG TPA: MFS transporter [Streptosporangiaceae bacterium]|jgi:predicted MFS family arabinose efflux permease
MSQSGQDAAARPAAARDAGVLITLRESPRPVKALLAGIFVNRLGAFIQIYLVLFLTSRGFTAFEAGAALSGYGAGSILGVVAGGALTDRLGPRRTTLVSMASSAVMIVAVLYLRDYPLLVAVVAVVGAASAVYRPACAALLSELTPAHRQVMIFAIYRLIMNLGTTAAPLLGAALIAVSYRLLFWGEAVAALAYAVIALAALPASVTVPAEAAGQPGPRAPAPAGSQAGQRASRPRRGYAAVLADRRYLLYLAAVLVNMVVYIQYVSALPLAMRAAGLATAWYAAVVAVNGLIVITCELLMTRLVQRWPPRVAVTAGFTLLGGGMAVYALPGGAAVFVAGTLVWSLAEIVAGPTMFAYPAMAAPAGLRGRYVGSAQAVFGLGLAIGPVAGVAGWHAAGRSLWWACGLACLAGLAVAWPGVRPPPDESAGPGSSPSASTLTSEEDR